MEEKKCNYDANKKPANATKPADQYPGVAVNDGDKNKDTSALQRERTSTLNNNPRNDM